MLGIPRDRLPNLELVAKVHNINRNHNKAIIRRCEKLDGYSALIAKMRECEAELAGGRKPQRLSDEEGREENREEIARNALREGLSAEIIQKITGLGLDIIRGLR